MTAADASHARDRGHPSESPGSPLVTVLTATYNRRAVLFDAVRSALGQTVTDLEVLIVDDGSSDGTAEEISRRYGDDARVRCLVRENGGPAAARNSGLDSARGTWIALLDSDDWWDRGYLAGQLAVLASHPDADLVICNGRRQDQDGSWHALFENPGFRPPTSVEAMCAGTWIQPSFTVVRAEVARDLRFDERFVIGEDADFMWRFLVAGHRCVTNPQSLAEYRAAAPAGRVTEEQLTADDERLMLGAYAVWQHWAARFPAVLHGRGPAFDRDVGQLLVRHDRFADARPHLWRSWRRRPFDRRAAALLLRSLAAARR